MIKLRHPSLEFNWLPNSLRKGLKTPRMIITDDENCGGRYWHRTQYDCVTPFDFNLREGAVIELAQLKSPGTIAHEYRHHWQKYNARLDGTKWQTPDSWDDYWNAVVAYFNTSWSEFDALRFQVKHAPDDFSLETWERVGKSRENPMTL